MSSEKTFFDLVTENKSDPVKEFSAPILSAYIFTVSTSVSLENVPPSGKFRLITIFPVYMIFFAAIYTFTRRLTTGLEPLFETFWEDLTVEGDQRVRLFPNRGNIQKVLRDLFPGNKYDGVNASRTIAVGFLWILICVLLQWVGLIILGIWVDTPVFDGLVSGYQSNKGFLTGVLAIINPLVAALMLILQNTAEGPQSVVIILILVGIPAILASPGIQNLSTGFEKSFVSFVQRTAGALPAGEKNTEVYEGIVTLVILLTLLILHWMAFR